VGGKTLERGTFPPFSPFGHWGVSFGEHSVSYMTVQLPPCSAPHTVYEALHKGSCPQRIPLCQTREAVSR
jgi:hypothetical protein